MELYYSFSILIVLASFFAYLNLRFLRLPPAIGIMLIAMLSSVLLVTFGKFFPETLMDFSTLLIGVDFTEVLMGAMLNFLLFAGAVHINIADLREQKLPVMLFSTVSVIISTFLVGVILFYLLPVLGLELPFLYCLLFGALISPTDPVAVLSILKNAKVPKSLETKVAGESLFNDGVAVVIFAVILKLASGHAFDVNLGNISWLLLKEAGGGFVLGAVLGYSASKAIKSVVAAGIIIGNYGKRTAMSEETKDYLNKFWELIDEIMNAVLFLFIGFELLLIPNILDFWVVGLLSILVVLVARFFSIWVPTLFIRFKQQFSRGTIKILVWGGLRGGVSIALALSAPESEYRSTLIAITYFVVVFSIVVQGLTVGKVARKALAKECS